MSDAPDFTALLGEHVRGDWSDRTYNCVGCTQRYEQKGQARFDALGREASREELIEFRNGYSKVSHPGWTLAEYNAHVASVLEAHTADLVRAAAEKALRDAASEFIADNAEILHAPIRPGTIAMRLQDMANRYRRTDKEADR